LQIVHATNSLFLIDDSAENAYEASTHTPPAHVLLFGTYPWNAVVHRPENAVAEDKMTYVEKEARGVLDKFAQRRQDAIKEAWLPEGVERVGNWQEVVQWVKSAEADGRWENAGEEGR
jgi:hypothetical protein